MAKAAATTSSAATATTSSSAEKATTGLADAGNDQAWGGAGDDELVGGDGKDRLYGEAGDDWLNGGDGADVMDGGSGGDVMIGGTGDDIYQIDTSADMVTEAIGEGTFDRAQTSVSYALAAGSEVEVLETSNSAGAQNLDLVGNEFGNIIVGNDGQNTIVGGLGLDTMTGRGGGDVFVWTSTAETRQAADQADVVMDFNRTAGDLLAVNPIDANQTVAGDQAFTFVGVVDFTSQQFTGAGQIGYFTTATDTYILLNTRVDAGPVDYEEATIRLAGVHTPDASWFVL